VDITGLTRDEIEKLEDEYDLQIVKVHEAEKAKGKMKYYTHEEIKKELDLTDAV
jgi:hypothetical protein